MTGDSWAATPRRFAMVTTFYPPYSFGGDATYLYRLVNALAADGHQVDVIHCADSYRLLARRPPPPAPPHHPNVRVRTLRSPFGPLSPLLTQQTGRPWLKQGPLREALVDARPDIVHFHNTSLIGPAALFVGDAPTLYTTHEHWLICPMHVLWKNGRELCEQPRCVVCQLRGKRPPQWWRFSGLLERALDRVDRFLAPSRFTMRMHLERGLAGRPFDHLPYFVPAPEALPPPPPPTARPYFLFVGRLERIKGLQTLIPLFRRWGRADLLVAGEGAYGDDLRRQAAGCERIRFLGRLDQETLTRLYRGATALIVPSICYEVFGIVMLEAFAVGTPAVARDLGALPEVIAESGGGLTYRTEAELEEILDRLLDDRALRDQLGENGRATLLRRWTTRPHLAQYYAIVAGLPR